MIGLPDVVGLWSVVSVEQIVRDTVRFAALMGQGDEGGVELLDDTIDPVVVGNGPSVLPRHLTHLSVDERHGGGGLRRANPSMIGVSAGCIHGLSSIPARAPGKPG